jgi:hypothetical protein
MDCPSTGGEWRLASMTFVRTNGNANLLRIYMGQVGAIWVDEISLRAVLGQSNVTDVTVDLQESVPVGEHHWMLQAEIGGESHFSLPEVFSVYSAPDPTPTPTPVPGHDKKAGGKTRRSR